VQLTQKRKIGQGASTLANPPRMDGGELGMAGGQLFFRCLGLLQ
jgi:hypothetical protein